MDFLKVIEKLSYCQPEQNTQVLHALVIAFGKVCQSSLVLLTWKPGWTLYQRNYQGSFISCYMILENLKQNVLEIGSMLGKEKGSNPCGLQTCGQWFLMWEGSRGNYLRRTLLMIWTSVEFSKSQKAQRDKKEKRSLFIHIYHPQAKTIDGLYLKDLSLQMISHWLEKLK